MRVTWGSFAKDARPGTSVYLALKMASMWRAGAGARLWGACKSSGCLAAAASAKLERGVGEMVTAGTLQNTNYVGCSCAKEHLHGMASA